MTQFPVLGALTDTIRVASVDLINVGLSILILVLGFAFTGSLLFGVEVSDTNNFWKTYERLLYYALGDGDIDDILIRNQTYFHIYYVFFCFIFYFLLIKILISVVSVQYRRLRTKKQLYNEANAQVIHDQVKEFRRILINLIF